MPDGQYFEAIRSYSVVDPVSDAIEVESSHVGRAGLFNARADVGLNEQDVDSGLQILANSPWSSGPVGGPPLDDALDLPRGAARDEELERPRLLVAT